MLYVKTFESYTNILPEQLQALETFLNLDEQGRLLSLWDMYAVENNVSEYLHHYYRNDFMEDTGIRDEDRMAFGRWIMAKIEEVDYGDARSAERAYVAVQHLPTWKTQKYVETITEDRWLVHFTDQDSAYTIEHYGFRGRLDHRFLAFTEASDMPIGSKGYVFAYDTEEDHWKTNEMYGDCVVLFRAKGIKMFYLPEKPAENSVVAWAPDCRDRLSFVYRGGKKGFYYQDEEDYIEFPDLETAIQWGMTQKS